MKTCPFCAEEIQDAARVCKHCGRDLSGRASGAVVVEQKKSTGCIAGGCAVIFAVLGLGIIQMTFCGPPTPAPRRSSPGSESPKTTVPRPQPKSGSGSFGRHSYTFQESEGMTVFTFKRPMPYDPIALTATIRHVLETDLDVDLKRSTITDHAPAIRFVTASGFFDAIPVRNENGEVIALGVKPRQ